MTATDHDGKVIAQSCPAAGQASLLRGVRSPVIGPAAASKRSKSQVRQALSAFPPSKVIPQMRDNAFRSTV